MAAAAMAAQTPHSSYFMESMPNRHKLNPAMTPDYNYVSLLPVLGGFSVGTNANIGINDFLFSRNGELVTGLNKQVSADEFLDGLKNDNYLEANLDLNIISFGFKAWGGFNTFDLSVKSTTGVNLPKDLFEFAKIGQRDGEATTYDFGNIYATSTNYVELAFGHSRQITDRFRAGAKFKYLAGVARMDLSIDQMAVRMSQDRWSVRETGHAFTSEVLDIRYKDNGEIDDVDYGKVGVAGNGIGIDLGATYRLLDNLTLSASLTDIGFISWKGSDASVDPDEFVFDGFHHLGAEDDPVTGESALDQETDQLEEDLKDLVRFRNETDARQTQSLSTTLNIGGEYSLLNNKISVGLLSSTRLGSKKKWSELMASANFRPVKWFQATVNGSVSNLGHSMGLLLNFNPRGFNFYIGSDYVPFKYAKQGAPISTAKVDVVMGMTITFGHNKHKKEDKK